MVEKWCILHLKIGNCSKPAKISDVHAERIETIDDHNPQYNLIDARINAIISSSVVSLYDTLSPKQVFVTDPIDVG